MIRRILAAAVLLLGFSFAHAKEIPASPKTYVHNERVLSEAGAKILSAKLAAFERASGHQFVVAAFQSLDGANLDDYTNKVFKAWKVGDRKRNDGLLLTLFKNDRKWRVEVGYGFEGQLTDQQAYQLVTAAAVPFLKRGDMDGGILAAADALTAEINGATLSGKPVPVVAQAAPSLALPRLTPVVPPDVQAEKAKNMIGLLILGLIVLIFLAWLTDGDIFLFLGSISFGGGDSDSGGGFSGGGGSSGGGGASGDW